MTKGAPTKTEMDEFKNYFLTSEKNDELGLNLEEFIILFFGYSPDQTVNGKTRFQKLLFLLNDKFKIFTNLDYFRYYYGPYSYILENAVMNLIINNYIYEEIIYFDDNKSRYQINRRLSEKGIEKFNELKNKNENQKFKEIFNFLIENYYYEMELRDLLKIVYAKAGYS